MSASEQLPIARWGVAGWAVVFAAFAVGFVNFPVRVLGWQFDHLPGDGIDNRLNNFVLEHGYRYLTGRADSFWDAPFFYPVPHITACSDTHIGLVGFYAGFRSLGLSPEHAFQAWFVLAFILNFVSAAWVLRCFGVGAAGTAVGAFLFTFGLPVVGQLLHAQLFPRFLVPPAILFGWQFLHAPAPWRLLCCLACVVGQFYVSAYIGILLGALLATGLMVRLVRLRCPPALRADTREWVLRAAMLLAAAGAMYPLVREHRRIEGGKDEHQIRESAPSPQSWLTPPPIAAVSWVVPSSDSDWEHHLFPGFLPLVAIGVGLVASLRCSATTERQQLVFVSAWSVVVLAVVVTDFGPVWLYKPVLSLPGGGSVRAVGRVVLVLLFPITLLMAFGVDELVRRVGRFGRVAVVLASALALGLAAADQWLLPTDGDRAADWEANQYPLALVIARQEAIEDAIAHHPHPTLLYAFSLSDAVDTPSVVRQLEAMRAAQDMGIPCVNGYSGYFPKGWKFFTNEQQVMNWLEKNHAPAERLAGVVYYGKPIERASIIGRTEGP